MEGHEGAVWSAAIDPKGKRVVTASADHTARVWNAATGKQLVVLQGGHQVAVRSAIFDAKGARILSTSSSAVQLWDASTGQLLADLWGNAFVRSSAEFDPKSERVLAATDDALRASMTLQN
jgi:WD40 repeat protein